MLVKDFSCFLVVFLYQLLVICVESNQNQVLIISFDGLQAGKFDEFVKQYPNSSFAKFYNEGVRAEYMVPSFPSVTFSNHITLATGLYPESHGITANSFYDPKYGTKAVINSNKNRFEVQWWNESYPIWLSAMDQGLTTASNFWVGSDVITRSPNIWLPYDPNYSKYLEVENAVNYITKFNVDLTLMYFDEPDSTGHTYGVSSSQYKDKIKEMDGIFGSLIDKLKQANAYDTTNIIVVSDHGMTDIKNTYIVSDYVNISKIDMNKSVFGVIPNIYAVSGEEQNVFNSLKAVPNISVYFKNDVPTQFHYSNNARIAPIVVIPSDGYLLSTSNVTGGTHGYNNSLESMRAIFLARGPNFKQNKVMNSFPNVNLYSLLCQLLEIQCLANNGTANVFKDYIITNSCSKSLVNFFPKPILIFFFIINYFGFNLAFL